ncbi:MAG: hypothetical protein SFU25_11605 [Candidatus Caenarcaniphilales bacterium]|nr:hypothetical protein [Candidatus Caenarcaniphilales bacterium]
MLEVNFTCVIFIFSFLVFVYLLNQTLWKPVGKIKQERDADISGELLRAVETERKTNEIIQQVHTELENIRNSEQTALNDIFKEFAQKKIDEENKLKSEFESTRQKTYAEVDSERLNLISHVEQESAKLANVIVQKLAPANLNLGVSSK